MIIPFTQVLYGSTILKVLTSCTFNFRLSPILIISSFRVSCGGSIYATPVLGSVILRGNCSRTELQRRQQLKMDSSLTYNIVIKDSIISTLAFVCSTKGSLFVISLSLIHENSNSDLQNDMDNDQNNMKNNENESQEIQQIGDSNKNEMIEKSKSCDILDTELSIIWESNFEVPIYGTPLVSTTYSLQMFKDTELIDTNCKDFDNIKGVRSDIINDTNNDRSYDDIINENQVRLGNCIILIRKDRIIVGVVDGTVRCMLLTSKVVIKNRYPLESKSNKNYSIDNQLRGRKSDVNYDNAVTDTTELNSPLRSNVSTVGEELWRVSYALRPIFSSPIFTHNSTKYYFNYNNNINSRNGNGIQQCGSDSGDNSDFDDRNLNLNDFNSNHEHADQMMKHSDCKSGGIVFGSHDGHLRCINLDGLLLWEVDIGSVLFSTPYVYKDEIVVAATTAGDVYLVSCGAVCDSNINVKDASDCINGNIEAPDHGIKMDGIILDKIKLDGEIYSSPIVYENVLYVGCRDDNIHAIAINNLNKLET
jgi:hypothetical protein